MKKSIFVLSLLLPVAAFAQTPAPEAAPVAAAAPAVVPVIPAPVKAEEPCLNSVSTLDLTDASLALDLTSQKIRVTGSLPKECADRLSLSNVKTFDPSKSSEELKDASVEKAEDLKEYSATVEVQITYSSDSKNATLHDCVANHKDSEKVDLSTDPHFSRTVFMEPRLAIAGLAGEPMNVKSPEFIKMQKQMEKLDCKDCNSNWKSLSKHLDEARGFDSPLLSSMMNKLFGSALSEMDKKIEDAASVGSLEKIRDQLLEMGKYATTEEQRGLQNALFEKIMEKNTALAGSGSKTASMATKHADFARDTYLKMMKTPGLPEDQLEALQEKADGMAPGKEERLQFLSSMDGDHPEIRQYLRSNEQNQRSLQDQMQRTCSGHMNQYRFTQCGEIQNQLNANQQRVNELQSRYTLADNQNWNGIFASWDQKNIAYNPQWKTSFIHNVQQNSPNSLPVMYDPRDQRYQNFDASKLYQTNNGMPGANPLFADVPYSVAPVVQ